MRGNRKYLVAVALLAVLAVVFGLAGTVAPLSEAISPTESPSSDSVTHFVNPPTFDSGWVDITEKLGQSLTLTHDLNTTEALVDVVGRQSLTGADHKQFFGSTTYVPEWNKTYDEFSDHAYSLVQTSDGGYAIAGLTEKHGTDSWLVKTDSVGNALWNRTYGEAGSANHDRARSVVQTSDGGYALAGYTRSFGAGNADFWLVKTDFSGNMQWNQTYGGAEDDYVVSVVQASDGGYAIAGPTYSYDASGVDFWLVKTNIFGYMEWNKTYGGTQDDFAQSLVQSSDGGYAMAGETNSFGGAGLWNFWLVKTGVEVGLPTGLSVAEFTNSTITLYRGRMDPFWNYVRVRIWLIKEPTWQFGDINQDGVVDINDLAIVGKNYGQTFSILSLTGIIAMAGIYTYKKRKQQK